MAMPADPARRAVGGLALGALLASPALAIFLATNMANAGNLAFNMVFSRLLTPAEFRDLAVLLTLMLGVLSVLGAAQMAVSQLAARGVPSEPALAALPRLSVLSGIAAALLLPLAMSFAFLSPLASALGLAAPGHLAILLLALPITAPLCLARGAALGRMSVRRIVLSLNLEMGVRLGGATLAFAVGLGLAGIVAALAVSLVAGWWPVRGETAGATLRRPGRAPVAPLLRRIAGLAWPFALLQLAQVIHLDGDLLISARVLSEADGGLLAGLSLVQRIQVYACLGLAGVLLPTVTAAAATGRAILRPAMPVIALVLGTGAVLAVVALAAPAVVLQAVAGPAYAAAATQMLPAVMAALAFTVSYLAATFLAALGDRSGIALIALSAPVSLAVLAVAAGANGLDAMVPAKAAVQGGLCLASVALVGRACLGARTSRANP
jgi:O-antigen/teichoic acid export membrane protein